MDENFANMVKRSVTTKARNNKDFSLSTEKVRPVNDVGVLTIER